MTPWCHLSFGTFSAELAAGINLFDVLAHTWDVAAMTDVSYVCPDEVWAAGLGAARRVICIERDPRHYAPQIPVEATASTRDRFLAFLGPPRRHP